MAVEEEAHRPWSLADLGLDAGTVGARPRARRRSARRRSQPQRKGEIYIGNDGAADRIVAFLVEQKVL